MRWYRHLHTSSLEQFPPLKRRSLRRPSEILPSLFKSEESQGESNYTPYYLVFEDVVYIPIHMEGFLQLRKSLSLSRCHCTRFAT